MDAVTRHSFELPGMVPRTIGVPFDGLALILSDDDADVGGDGNDEKGRKRMMGVMEMIGQDDFEGWKKIPGEQGSRGTGE